MTRQAKATRGIPPFDRHSHMGRPIGAVARPQGYEERGI